MSYFIFTSKGKIYFDMQIEQLKENDSRENVIIDQENFNIISELYILTYHFDDITRSDDGKIVNWCCRNFIVEKNENVFFIKINTMNNHYGSDEYPEFIIFETNPIDYDIKKQQSKLLNSVFKFE